MFIKMAFSVLSTFMVFIVNLACVTTVDNEMTGVPKQMPFGQIDSKVSAITLGSYHEAGIPFVTDRHDKNVLSQPQSFST